jgi:hypothetical protein
LPDDVRLSVENKLQVDSELGLTRGGLAVFGVAVLLDQGHDTVHHLCVGEEVVGREDNRLGELLDRLRREQRAAHQRLADQRVGTGADRL